MMFLLRFWPVLAALGLFALLGWGASVALDRADQRGYDRATAEMQRSIADANATARLIEQVAQKRANEVDHDHQQAIASLNAKYAARPIPAVRLCPPAARQVRVPAVAAASRVDPGPAEPVGLPSRDIGPDLERLARAADEQTQRLIACQRFIAP